MCKGVERCGRVRGIVEIAFATLKLRTFLSGSFHDQNSLMSLQKNKIPLCPLVISLETLLKVLARAIICTIGNSLRIYYQVHTQNERVRGREERQCA